MTIRVGFGYDVHAFAPNRPLVLGGVIIPSEHGLSGHSDADVVIHAIVDALLGAAALGDIGQHFPSNDERWKNQSTYRTGECKGNYNRRTRFRRAPGGHSLLCGGVDREINQQLHYSMEVGEFSSFVSCLLFSLFFSSSEVRSIWTAC